MAGGLEGEPLVSVVMPVFNKERYLGSAVRCVLAQDVEPLELVCVDDCSTDRSVTLLRHFAAIDPRVKVVCHERNRGAGAARNTGLEHATGRFVAFLDADDWYSDPTYLRRLCQGALDAGVPAAGASLCNVRTPYFTETSFLDNPEFAGYTFAESGVIDYADYQFDYGSPRFVYERGLFEGPELRFDERTFYEDPVVMVRALYRAGSFYADSHARYLYRVGYRKPSWTTRKAVDLLEGVRQNLSFALEHGLGKLYWITVAHLDWESDTVPLGIDPMLDAGAIDAKLQEVECYIDRELLEYLDPGCAGYEPLLRRRLRAVQERGSLGNAARVDYTIRASRPWHHLRAVRDMLLRS